MEGSGVTDSRANDQTKTILIVEDNPDHIELISINLQKSNHKLRLIQVEDGQQALEKIGLLPSSNTTQISKPDLIFLDVNLPKFTGTEVLERIRSQNKFNKIPVVILTTSTRKEDKEKMLKLGANDYLIKSNAKLNLSEKLNDLLFRKN